MKGFFLITISYLLFNPITSITVECDYEVNWPFHVLGKIYFCDVQNNLGINSPDQVDIGTLTGFHKDNKIDDDVAGFRAIYKDIKYFPKSLENFFKNLKLIYVENGRLKEIHQSDLRPHQHLESLSLESNEIEVIEDELFDYNPKLKLIWLSKNRIFYVGKNAFDKLSNLKYLYFEANICIDQDAAGFEAVQNTIRHATEFCPVNGIINLLQKLASVDNGSYILRNEIFPNLKIPGIYWDRKDSVGIYWD